ncbi:MAG TPA: DUF1800 domain-containing protein [Bacteroidota bacterium]|nr:DUF1800 domain-containing protein [Bacteroidota bacterium]
MERRASLAAIASAILETDEPSSLGPGADDHQFANKTLPRLVRTSTGLEPYTGPWTATEMLHLLRRTTFGPAKADLATLGTLANPGAAVDLLLAPQPEEPTQPLATDSRELVPVGSTWVNALYKSSDPTVTFNPVGIRTTSLKAWWIGLMLNQQLSIREKMTLFWHNHFVTAIATVADPRYSYQYVALLRRNVLGNFKSLVDSITQDGAMLVYLNGTNNQKSGPDENYGRELQELFTIGKGPLVAPGDYTNYTEADVKAAAHVLTGWRKYQNADGTIGQQTGYFDVTRHDTTDQTFSADYGNTVIAGSTDGAAELEAMLTMIFSQNDPDGVNRVARFISRKFYRWFIYYVIDANAEANVITPMANLISANNFDVLPALSTLLKSAHFFDPNNMGCMIKSPLDFIGGLCRQFNVLVPSADVTKQYAMWYSLEYQGATMGQDLGDPPNVAGWEPYYQIPEFYELWINSDTLKKRRTLSDALTRSGFGTSGGTLVADPIAFVKSVSDPTNPNVIVAEAVQQLFAVTPTDTQVTFLKNTLLPGLPDMEWTNEWNAYIADPTNAANANAVKAKIQALLSLMTEMPEYQLE